MDSRASAAASMADLGTADNSVPGSLRASADAGLDRAAADPSLPPADDADEEGTLKVTLFPFVDPSRSAKPVMFDPIVRTVGNGSRITIGRRVEPKGEDGKRREDGPFVTVEDGFIGYKSKVVSRSHAEIWVKDGQLYFKDIGSSSGTFLNRMRLSPSGRESRPYPLKDSDVIQLGVDYQNRPEDIYKAIVMRVLVQHPDGTKKQVNPVKLHAALKSLIAAASPLTNRSDDPASTVDCAICLNCIAPFQALFLAPCSHCFHFKCIKPLIDQQGVMFLCPMCRQVANLEASVSSENLLEGFDEGSTTQESDTEGEARGGGDGQTLGRVEAAEALAAAGAAAAAVPVAEGENHVVYADPEDGMEVDAGEVRGSAESVAEAEAEAGPAQGTPCPAPRNGAGGEGTPKRDGGDGLGFRFAGERENEQ
ncbi:hypothetical protein DFJ74DRAFT_626270 [Hyaloraphidium curvatum]|nr:hypothetical protein DFJ74DRAFT_626270 [Hyaloraphidium curvatum]